MFFEQLKHLGGKFDVLSKEEINDYEEMESKITTIVKEFSSLEYVNESVCEINRETGLSPSFPLTVFFTD